MLPSMDTPLNVLQELKAFFGKLDWKNPFTYLAILGALGAPSSFIQAWRWIRSFGNTALLRWWRPAVLNDFYYIERDFGYRILEDGSTYLSVRKESVVSMVKQLASVPVSYLWSGGGEITPRVEPNSLSLEDRPKVVGRRATCKCVVFEKPLEKREKRTFVLILRCEVKDHQPENYVSSSSSRRVDKLILRVAFPVDRRPARVTFRILDGDGSEKSHEALECADYLTGEYRKGIRYPKPFFEHRIEWELG
jgi:hypothetical protein